MSDWAEILQAPPEQDLSGMRAYLQARGIPTYVFERAGMQCLCVPTDIDHAQLWRTIEHWRLGDRGGAVDTGIAVDREALPGVFAQWRTFPLTLALIVMSVLCFLMVATPWGQAVGGWRWLAALTLQPMIIHGDEILLSSVLPGPDQLWRYWTPVFLHFSPLHILFNSLMLLELGRRIEAVQGFWRLLCLLMLCGLLSNLAQFHANPGSLFGGMSGVIYGLVGYCWLYQRLRPDSGLQTPPGLMVMSVVWLLLCFSGLVTLAGLGNIANAAHVGGLVSGLVLAVLLTQLDRKQD